MSKSLDFHRLLETESCDVLPDGEPRNANSEGLPEDIVMDEVDDFVRGCWSSEILLSTSRLSGDKSGSGVLSPFHFLNIDAAVDFFELLPCVVVDPDCTEPLADDSGREWSEGVLGSGTLLAG